MIYLTAINRQNLITYYEYARCLHYTYVEYPRIKSLNILHRNSQKMDINKKWI